MFGFASFSICILSVDIYHKTRNHRVRTEKTISAGAPASTVTVEEIADFAEHRDDKVETSQTTPGIPELPRTPWPYLHAAP
jgi:hypothetical protein